MATDSRRLIVAASSALVIGVVVGFFLGGVGTTKNDEGRASDQPVEVQTPGATDQRSGDSGDDVRTEAGAVAAAVNFTLLPASDSLLTEEAVVQATSALAAPDWKDEAETRARAGHRFIVGRYGKQAQIAGSVLEYDVRDFTSDRATVDLWVVTVVSSPTRPAADEVWSTVTVELSWLDGAWRVTGNDSEAGPAPVDLPAEAPTRSAKDLMEEFREFSETPVR